MSKHVPLVLVPGLLCDDWTWHAQAKAFQSGRKILVPDLAHLTSIAAMAEAILTLVPGRFALVGHSLGGRIALETYRKAPERVERLALMDSGTHPASSGEPAARGSLVALARSEGMSALADRWLPGMVLEGREAQIALMEPLKAMVCRSTPDRFANQVAALLGRPDAAPVLPTIACPTVILCGRQDRWSPLDRHEAMAASIHEAVLEIIEESGHMTPVEQPDAVTKVLSRWLAV